MSDLELHLITASISVVMHEWASDSSQIIERFEKCVNLLNQGGGNINVFFASEQMESILKPEWILQKFNSLNMANILIPADACFCLMHPEVLRWELNRNDFETLNEESSA